LENLEATKTKDWVFKEFTSFKILIIDEKWVVMDEFHPKMTRSDDNDMQI
jgi:hypothetical protein